MLLHWQLDHEHIPPRPTPNWLPFSYSEYLLCCPLISRPISPLLFTTISLVYLPNFQLSHRFNPL